MHSDQPGMTRAPEQWGRSFLETYVVPRLANLTEAARAEHRDCIGAWRLDAVQRAAQHDDARFRRLLEIVDGRLQLILMRYSRRTAFNIIRALRSEELLGLVPVFNARPDFFAQALIRATKAIVQHGQPRASARMGDATVVPVTVAELTSLVETFPTDLARICVLAVLRYLAEIDHRRAGKGLKLAAFDDIHWRFEPDPPLEAAMAAYDERSNRAPRLGGAPQDGPEELAWPRLVVCQVPIRVSYPAARTARTSWSYLLTARDVSGRAAQLEELADEFRDMYGLDVRDFLALCRRLTEAVLRRTGVLELEQAVETKRGIEMRSSLKRRDERLTMAPSYLYTVMSEGVLRAPRETWVDMLSEVAGRRATEMFVAGFTSGAQHSDMLLPALFHDLEPNSLAFDLLLADEFFDLCRHAVLVGSDGATGVRKGKRFEEQARRTLTTRLGLDVSRMPIPANALLRKLGLGDGEVDFSFTVGRTLVHVQLKSWSRNHAYHRGEFNAVRNRVSNLRDILAKNDEYGQRLLTLVPQVDSVVTFVCVPAPEYVSPDPFFHAGPVPRVLTPDELADAVESEEVWSQVVCSAG